MSETFWWISSAVLTVMILLFCAHKADQTPKAKFDKESSESKQVEVLSLQNIEWQHNRLYVVKVDSIEYVVVCNNSNISITKK